MSSEHIENLIPFRLEMVRASEKEKELNEENI